MTDDDRARFELLYRQHFRAVLRYALARLDSEQAKDVTAETFLITWRRLPEVPSEPTAWLFGVARKVIAGQLRADARREALGMRLAVVREQTALQADLSDQVAEHDGVLRAFARLSESDREVLRLVAWDRLASKVAADVLGVSRLAFAVRLHRARRRLAAELAVSGSSARVTLTLWCPRQESNQSKEALMAAFEAVRAAAVDFDYDDREARPRDVWNLSAV